MRTLYEAERERRMRRIVKNVWEAVRCNRDAVAT